MTDKRGFFERIRQCFACPPPAVSGVTAFPGGGSGEVLVTWNPMPAKQRVTHYRVYALKGTGTRWHLADVTNDAMGRLESGRLGIVDAPDYWPWPASGVPSPRCYVVTAVAHGLEGPPSVLVSASPL